MGGFGSAAAVFAAALRAATVLAVVVCAAAEFTAAVFVGFETAVLRKIPKNLKSQLHGHFAIYSLLNLAS